MSNNAAVAYRVTCWSAGFIELGRFGDDVRAYLTSRYRATPERIEVLAS